MSDTKTTELLFTPLVSGFRRKLDRMHFMAANEDAPWEQFTFCGLSARDLDSGCLDDMDYTGALGHQDVCKRCMAHIRRAVANEL